MDPHGRVIDYDKIDDWSPWLDEIIGSIGPKGLIDELRQATPEYIENARDLLVTAIGRAKLIDDLHQALAPYHVRVFHGTRVTPEELRSIKKNGLRDLKLVDRRRALVAIFSRHPEWAAKERLLDDLLHRFGPGWERNSSGKREDGSVHVCLSRAGILYGCNRTAPIPTRV